MTPCETNSVVCAANYITMGVFSAALLFAVVRVLRGPSTPDRVVGLDLSAMIVVGLMAVYAIMYDEPSLLSGALVLGLLTFLGTVAIAGYLERGGDP